MNLKVKLTSTVCAFFLIMALVIMGVFAMPTVTVSLKGSLTFQATNVSATVEGVIANTNAETQPTLTPLTYKAEYTEAEQTALTNAENEWKDCDLTFKDDGSAIVITLTITNNATDRPLYASVNKDFSCNFENVTTVMTKKAREGTEETDTIYQGTTIEIPADKDDNLNFVNIEISMEVTNKNTSLSKDATYGFKVLLNDQAVEQEKLHYDFSTVEGKNVATVSMVSTEVTTGDIIIPETVINPTTKEVHTVTSIADFAFIDQVKFGQAMTDPGNPDLAILSTAGAPITSIVLPETITRIGFAAFGANMQLESINIPSSVTELGDMAFALTSTLKAIEIINMPTITDIQLGDPVVFLGSGIESVKIDNGEIPMAMFEVAEGYPTSLKTVELGNGVTSIGEEAFDGCSSLSSVTVGENCTIVGGNAFWGCDNISLVEYNNGKYLTDITGKKTVIMDVVDKTITNFTLPTECKIIYDEAFADCTDLNSIDLSNVTSIGVQSFRDCHSLISVNLSNVQNIEGHAFWLCSSLSTPGSIIVGSGVTSIGSYAIPTSACVLVNGVYYLQDKEGANRYLIKPESTSIQSHTVDTNCTVIAGDAFNGCSSLSSIDLSNVTSIGDTAFSNCSSLSSIDLSKVTSIGSWAFNGCSSLSSIDLSKVTSIGDTAFYECSGLTSITLSNKCTSIDTSAFRNCPTTMSVTFNGTQEEWNALVSGVEVLSTLDSSKVTITG